MPAQIFGTDAVVTMLNRAFNDVSPSNATFLNQKAAAGNTTESQTAFALQFGAGYAGMTADALSTLLLGNLGVLPNTALQTALKDYITAAGVSNVGIIALQLGQILSNLENATGDQAGFKAAAAAWNNEVTIAYNYSANPANTGPSTPGPVVIPGSTLTLNDKVGEVVAGTNNNDVISGVLGDATGLTTTSTLNLGDSIDGGAGTDVFNLLLAGAANKALPSGVVVKNVETINVTHTDNAAYTGALGAGAVLSSSSYTGATALWQIDNSATGGTFDVVTVGAGVTAGFRSTGAVAGGVAVLNTAVVTAASATQTTLAAAVDGVADNSEIVFAGTGVKTITLGGTVAAETAVKAGDLIVTGAATTETLNLNLTSAVGLTVSTVTALKTIDASGSTGAITAAIDSTAQTGLTSLKTGSGNDTITYTFNTKSIAIDLGVGNDTITLGGTVGSGGKGEITLGAGKDTVVVGAALANLGGGVTNATELEARLITVKDFAVSEDVLNFAGQGKTLTAAQLTTIKGSADIFAAATAAVAIAAGGTVAFSFGADTYVLSDNGTSGSLDVADALVKVVGVDASVLTNVQNGNLVL